MLSTKRTSAIGRRQLDLDVVRGIAILLAVGWHLGAPSREWPVLAAFFWPALTFGWAGVDLFFVLSGFLVGRLILREHDETGRFGAKRFLVRRMFKLWPMFYLFLFAEVVFGDDDWRLFLFQNVFHIQNYLSSAHPHLWSLAVEEHFYLLVALLLSVAFRGRWKTKIVAGVLTCVLVLCLALRVVALLISQPFVQIQWETQYRVDGLAFGFLLALIAVRTPALFRRLIGYRAVWALCVVGAVAWVVAVPIFSPLGVTLGFSVAYLGAGALVLLIYESWATERLRVLLRPVALLGVYSYAIYLWHIAIGGAINRGLEGAIPNDALRMIFEYLGVIAFAVLITRLVEWPSLRLRNRVFPDRSAVLENSIAVDDKRSNKSATTFSSTSE